MTTAPAFSAAELALLRLSDAVDGKPTAAELNRIHSADSVRRRIERIGRDEYLRQKRETARLWYAKRKANPPKDQTP